MANIARILASSWTLRAGLLGGIVNVLVDIDHLPALGASRWLHPTLGLIAGIIALGIIACLGRLYIKLVLRKLVLEKKNTVNTVIE